MPKLNKDIYEPLHTNETTDDDLAIYERSQASTGPSDPPSVDSTDSPEDDGLPFFGTYKDANGTLKKRKKPICPHPGNQNPTNPHVLDALEDPKIRRYVAIMVRKSLTHHNMYLYEDVLQEVFIRLSRRGWDPSKGAFTTYFHPHLYNLVRFVVDSLLGIDMACVGQLPTSDDKDTTPDAWISSFSPAEPSQHNDSQAHELISALDAELRKKLSAKQQIWVDIFLDHSLRNDSLRDLAEEHNISRERVRQIIDNVATLAREIYPTLLEVKDADYFKQEEKRLEHEQRKQKERERQLNEQKNYLTSLFPNAVKYIDAYIDHLRTNKTRTNCAKDVDAKYQVLIAWFRRFEHALEPKGTDKQPAPHRDKRVKVTQEQVEKIHELRAQNKTYEAIARELNINARTVFRYAKKSKPR